MDYSGYKTFRIWKEGKVGVYAFDYPSIENRIDPLLHRELETIWEDIAKDDEVNVAILTGIGPRFMGGIDPGFMKRVYMEKDRNAGTITYEGARKVLHNFLEVDKPIISAVNGPAASLGANMALFCDVIIASEKATFCDPHVAWGLVAGDGAPIIWPLLIGMAKAKQYVLTGDVVSAQEAERIGLVNQVVPHDQLMPTAMALAQRLANGATKAIRGTKMCFNKRLWQDVNLIFDLALSLEWDSMRSRDLKEAVRAYTSGEKPKFVGK